MPIKPSSPSWRAVAYGNALVLSSSSATGATSFSAKSRTVRRSSSWSSGRSKSMAAIVAGPPICPPTVIRVTIGLYGWDEQPIAWSMRPRLTLGLKLGLAFAGVLAVMLISLAVVSIQSGKADAAYHDAIAWNAAVAAAGEQASGARQQQAAQALYVA